MNKKVTIRLVGKKLVWIPDLGVKLERGVEKEIAESIAKSLFAQNTKDKIMFEIINKKGAEK